MAALQRIRELKDFVVEEAKSARAFLGAVGLNPREVRMAELNEHTDSTAVASLLKPLREGRPLGLLSEAGCPAIADPGAALVEAAHVGPSAVTLALMASGLEGQRFAFCGYLPRDSAERAQRIKQLEQRSRREHETEIFIETPYRNDALLGGLLDTCAPATRLCVAADLTLATESIRTQSVRDWRRSRPSLGKRPAVFLLLART